MARCWGEADASGVLDWTVIVDYTINRVHQHATMFGHVKEPPASDLVCSRGHDRITRIRGRSS